MTTLAQLLAGVRQVESGGNYSVVNGIGAVGAYQVMKANIPSWTKRALGYSVSWQTFRDSPSIQDKVASVVLGGYYNKYGAAGAASMWFSGQPNPNSKASDGGNTVSQYVAKVLAASGSSSTSSGGGGYSASAVTPKMDNSTLAQMYGLTYATINANKELKSLFGKAVAGTWSADRFTASLKNTKWWRTTSDSARKFFLLKTSDPATYKQKYSAAAYHVNDLAVKLGVRNLLGKGSTPGHIDQFLDRVVQYQMRDGWSDARIQDYLGSYVSAQNGIWGGTAGESFDQLHQVAYVNGLTHSADWYKNNVRAIASGRSTLEGVQAGLRKVAAAKYSAFSAQIMAGQNAIDLAAPYTKSVATLLELPETDVDLSNKYVSKAMTAKGGADGAQYPLWQFENDVRNDPLWKKTNNAREGIMTVAHQVAQNFGVAW